jgi:hypothetical protein
MVQGKTILVLNLGVNSKRFILEAAERDKIKVLKSSFWGVPTIFVNINSFVL